MVRVEVEETVVRPTSARTAPRADAPVGEPAHGDPAACDPAPGDPAGRRRHVGRWLVGAVALALGLVGAQATLDARDRALDARLARVAGAAERLDAAPAPAWRTDGVAATAIGQRLVAGGLAVGVLTMADGSRDVAAYDLADGRRRWLVRIDGPDALRARTDAPRATASCALVPVAAGAPQVACVTTDQVATRWDGMLYVTRQARHGHLVVLDAATGRRVVDRETAPTPALAVLPGLVVLAQAGGDGRTHVVAEDLTTGAVRWRFVSPDRADVALAEPLLRLFRVGDEVVLVDGSGTPTVLTADGAARRPTTGPLLGWSQDATGRVWLVTGAAVGSGDASARTVVVRPGLPDLALPGRGAAPTVDDASLPGLVVSSDRAGTLGTDATTGAARWRSPVQAEPIGSLVLGGRVVLGTADGVAALDGRDGSTAWVARTDDGAVVSALASDGRRVLAVEQGDAGTALVALRASDGGVEWRAALPPGDLRVLDRRLVVVGAGSATRVAP
jgi:outer membrane protein assembly factor BamB